MGAKLTRLAPRIQPIDPPKGGGWSASQQGRTTTERGYGWAWQKKRERVIKRDAGLCQPCKRRSHITPGCREVDHITNQARGGGDNEENLQTICSACHKAKTQAEAQGLVWDEAAPDRAA